MSSPIRTKRMRNCEDAGSDADGSFASCLSEPVSPTWRFKALLPQMRKLGIRKQGEDEEGIATPPLAKCGSASLHSVAQDPPPGSYNPASGISVPAIHHQQQRSPLPLIDFLARFKPSAPCLSPQPQQQSSSQSAIKGSPRRASSSSSTGNNSSPLLLSLRRLQSGSEGVKNGNNRKRNDWVHEEDKYEVEEQDATPCTPLLHKGRTLNNTMQSKHRDYPSPPSPLLPPSLSPTQISPLPAGKEHYHLEFAPQ